MFDLVWNGDGTLWLEGEQASRSNSYILCDDNARGRHDHGSVLEHNHRYPGLLKHGLDTKGRWASTASPLGPFSGRAFSSICSG